MFHSITLKDGSDWACEGRRGGSTGSGIFSRKADGTWQQHRGTGDTPVFHSPAGLSRYIHARHSERDGGKLPRMISHNW
jgi:hypothetical protein